MATCTGKRGIFVCANHSKHAKYPASYLALSSDGSGLIDCHARSCRPWVECSEQGICSIAGPLWTVQPVPCCYPIAA